MSEPTQRRRVLLAAEGRERADFRELFQSETLRTWEIVEVDSLERARFMLHLDPCDALLLDCSLYRRGVEDDLSWLASQRRTPVLFLADGEPETLACALRQGAHYWLPREVARRHASVLAVMLRQAAEFGEVQRRGQETSDALEDARRQVSRLVNLLWEAVPGEGRARWFTQRHMLERLEEEVIRAQRYGGPLSVILGEVEDALPRRMLATEGEAATWIVDQISRVKRRSDVAGQYGLQGFMMLLPQTDEAGATGCCRRLRKILEQPAEPAGSFGPRITFGIACFSPDTHSVKSLLSRAEEHLERGKVGAIENLPN
ncbi:MAG TPA: diguanylate cyclase [Gemmataceae bacterium]|nr:diguanylate cyclase [Gemmataceae bacterium]